MYRAEPAEQWMYRAEHFPVSPKNCLFKTIFWVTLLYQLSGLCLQGDSPVSLLKNIFKPIFWVKLSFRLNELCLLGDLIMNVQTCFPRVTNKQPFQDHLLSTTTLTHRPLCPNRCPVPKETWTMNVQSRVFLNVTDEMPFQDHHLSEIIISPW